MNVEMHGQSVVLFNVGLKSKYNFIKKISYKHEGVLNKIK